MNWRPGPSAEDNAAPARRVWSVGALCRAVADTLEARFNPVSVSGEISGFSRAASGHCYFNLKDADGQIRCAMFRRAAGLLDALPRDGDVVEVFGRLGVYEARGDLQLIVEGLRRAGQGTLFEQFMRLKAKLEAEGLFDARRKRPLAELPRGIGIVTSLGAAALHDVLTALRRRAPHIPVIVSPASVQGAQAPAELVQALRALYAQAQAGAIDTILVVRGGGSLEDLWAFNDEQLARTIVQSPVPLVCGVGHETDFTIADFCADLRAPTPTAAAEMAAQPREAWLALLDAAADRVSSAVRQRQDRAAQRLDLAAQRLGRPSQRIAGQRLALEQWAHRLRQAPVSRLDEARTALVPMGLRLQHAMAQRVASLSQRVDHLGVRLEAVDPRRVLERGYALLTDEQGHALTRAAQARAGQSLHASLADGVVDLTVSATRPNPP